MEQGLFLSCLSLFVNKTDYISTGAEKRNDEENNTKETELPF